MKNCIKKQENKRSCFLIYFLYITIVLLCYCVLPALLCKSSTRSHALLRQMERKSCFCIQEKSITLDAEKLELSYQYSCLKIRMTDPQ